MYQTRSTVYISNQKKSAQGWNFRSTTQIFTKFWCRIYNFHWRKGNQAYRKKFRGKFCREVSCICKNHGGKTQINKSYYYLLQPILFKVWFQNRFFLVITCFLFYESSHLLLLAILLWKSHKHYNVFDYLFNSKTKPMAKK